MPDRAWKQLERDAANLIGPGGKRFWANSGERLDIESDYFLGQCKLVKTLSLSALTKLAVEVQGDGDKKGKFGVVVTKLRAGKGNKTPILVTMTADEFAHIVRGLTDPSMPTAVDVPKEEDADLQAVAEATAQEVSYGC